MNRTCVQYLTGGIGMFLAILGIIWTCRTFSEPGKLSASDRRAVELTADNRHDPVPFSPATIRVTSPKRNAAQMPVDSSAPTKAPKAAATEISTSEISSLDISPSNNSSSKILTTAGEERSDKIASEPFPSVPAPMPLTLTDEPSKKETNEPQDISTGKAATSASPQARLSTNKSATSPLPQTPASPMVLSSESPATLKDAESLESASFNVGPTVPAPLPNQEPKDSQENRLSLGETSAPTLAESPGTLPSPLPSPTANPPFETPAVAESPAASNPSTEQTPETAKSSEKPTDTASSSLVASRQDFATDPLAKTKILGGTLASARPGNPLLEGPQKALLVLKKEVPEEVQVGREEVFRILLKNEGEAAARGVVLRDAIPIGTSLVSTNPRVEPTERGELIWDAFDLAPQEERAFEYRIIPESEGPIGSVASVSFSAEASGKTICTRPDLKLSVEAPGEVLIGEDVTMNILISNPGSGTARGIVLMEDVPTQLEHPNGRSLNNQIGEIRAGETKKLALTLKSVAAGMVSNRMRVTGENNLADETTTEIRVNAPELSLEIAGARLRYLERNAVYRLRVWNPGTASAKGVRLVADLPKEMEFVKTNNEGAYQESTHSVHWELVELPNGIAPGEIELEVLPKTAGVGRLTFRGEGEGNLTASTSQEIEIDGMPAVSFTVTSLSDPVEVGRDAVYEIKIANRGTKESTNVKLAIQLPPATEMVEAVGPSRYAADGSQVTFGPLSRIGAKEEVVYKVTTRCAAPGDHRIRVQVASDDMEPLVKEESVRVYGEN